MLAVDIIADSVNSIGDRLTSFEVTTHRFTLAEWNTHCLFARNSASSRAIPFTKMLERYMKDPAYPFEWPCEKPGMSGGALLHGEDLQDAGNLWDEVRGMTAEKLSEYLASHQEPERRLHKSLLNRLMEPMQWHTILITAASYENFFDLRVSPHAMPEIRIAAKAMEDKDRAAEPRPLHGGEWHLPYVRTAEQVTGSTLWSPEDDMGRRAGYDGRIISASRCAATSYDTQWADKGYAKEVERYHGLVESGHWSPLEHVCTPYLSNAWEAVIPDPDAYWQVIGRRRVARIGKFPNWLQWRHVVEGRRNTNTYR